MTGKTPDVVASELAMTCGVTAQRARTDVEAFVDALAAHLLVRLPLRPSALPTATVTRRLGRYFDDPDCRISLMGRHLLGETGPTRAALLRSVFSSGVAELLFAERLFLPFTPGPSDDGALTLRSDAPVRITYWFEWCQAMWKDALLHTIDVLIALARHELTLRTVAPWHVQYAGGRPIHINPGSIVSFSPDALLNCFDKMRRYLIPALLMAGDRRGPLARTLLRGDVNNGIPEREFPPVRSIIQSWHALLAANPDERGLAELRMRVADIGLPATATKWTDWQAEGNDTQTIDRWTHRQRLVSTILDLDRPASVTDIGANSGWYSRLAASRGADVVAIDADEECANRIHAGRAGGVVPIVLDVADPTPAIGPNYRWWQPATERLQSDMVFALALIDLLVFSRYRLPFDEIAAMLKAFTGKTLVIEFMSLEDPARRAVWWPGSAEWYNLDTFVAVLRRTFARVTVLQPVVNEQALIVCDCD